MQFVQCKIVLCHDASTAVIEPIDKQWTLQADWYGARLWCLFQRWINVRLQKCPHFTDEVLKAERILASRGVSHPTAIAHSILGMTRKWLAFLNMRQPYIYTLICTASYICVWYIYVLLGLQINLTRKRARALQRQKRILHTLNLQKVVYNLSICSYNPNKDDLSLQKCSSWFHVSSI